MEFFTFKKSLGESRISLIPRVGYGDVSAFIFDSFLLVMKDIRQFIKFNFTIM